ncbi:MAG: hypothetical protein M3R13_06210 [Armatimonadota bacterium]|nr:hypothetical protein [Armatimonadota bacterium]
MRDPALRTRLILAGIMIIGAIVANVGAAVGNMFLLMTGTEVALPIGIYIKFLASYDPSDQS